MKIYIKENLREIPIFNQMYQLIKAYGEKYGASGEEDSMTDYRYSLSNDYVFRFIDYVIPEEEDPEVRKNKVTYLTSIFYLTKGTYKVLDYLLDYDLFQTTGGEGKDTTTAISYSARNISIDVKSLPQRIDRELFCDYLEKFLCALLYFESLTINVDGIRESLVDNTTAALNHGQIYFQYYEAREEEE